LGGKGVKRWVNGGSYSGGSLRYNNTTDYKFSGLFFAGLGTELFPFKNGCCYRILRWYFNCIYFGGGQLAFKAIFFHCLKNTSIHGQKVLNPLFLFVKLSCCYLHIFFIQFTQSAMFEKKLNIPAPYISDQFYYYRSDLPTLLSTSSKISQNFRHFPVFLYAHNHM